MANISIELKDVTKIYRLFHSPKDRLREIVNLGRKRYHHEFHALKGLSLSVEKGKTLGIIGQNGSGKSTLLKVICGVVKPTSGSVSVRGRVSALLELGAGFHPEFTGRENVYMNGALTGLSRREIDHKFPAIEAFAEIGEYIDQPVKTYSSGMFVRLAFASAIHVEPDILVVDEALAVGDMFFQTKCLAMIEKLVHNGTTLIFVSHDLWAVKKLCEACIWLNEGGIVESGESRWVVEKYFGSKIRNQQAAIGSASSGAGSFSLRGDGSAGVEDVEFQKRASFQRIQNGKARFLNVQLLSDEGRHVGPLAYEQRVTLRMAIQVQEDLRSLISGYHIRDKHGIDVVYSDGVVEETDLVDLKAGERYLIDWSFRVSLMEETYIVACVLSCPVDGQPGRVEFCDFVPVALQFSVMPRDVWPLHGRVHWENRVEVRKVASGNEIS